MTVHTVHQFKVEGIAGGEIDFASFKGKKLIIVNVASECGFTPQYDQLQELYEAFSDKLAIVGFPSNDFGGQEPGGNETIQNFCKLRYGVTFPLAAKINILGADGHPVFRWLTDKSANGVMDTQVRWNFQKYLLDEDGKLVKCLSSTVSPLDDAVVGWVSTP